MAILAALLGMSAARADNRVALVFGNSTYQSVPLLPNPANDAADMSAALTRLGFSVKTLTDARYDDMRRALIEFGRQARGVDLAVIYFAGHGIQMGTDNWLIPVDAQMATDLDIPNEAISLQSMMRAVSNTSRLGLVVLDACRNNPFSSRMQTTNVKRSVERGFSRVEPANNVLVAYAARDGTTAQDGSGRNSPFTQSLLKNIETPNLEITFLFRNVRDDVLAATKRIQEPFLYGSLSKDPIYLKQMTVAPSEAVKIPSIDPAAQAWAAAQNITSVAVLEEFIRRYGDSFYASVARARIQELKREPQLALAKPAPTNADAPKPPDIPKPAASTSAGREEQGGRWCRETPANACWRAQGCVLSGGSCVSKTPVDTGAKAPDLPAPAPMAQQAVGRNWCYQTTASACWRAQGCALVAGKCVPGNP
ncbi:caspase family protein [Bradyrhizobium japonicum]|uniref:caspase family protein n=1 Tax=Bradyrhizobium japonicum TaxID=375 RepID=UPI001BA61BF9|nr:caspase family protein [Bradyrhizobium japonicum]MBR0750002.1 caspase family protein [Bradyrhizobium japonicum]